MKGFYKIHTTIITIQVCITFVSLVLSSLSIFIRDPFMVYFWYLSLFSIVMMMATSFLLGLVIVFARIFFAKSSRGDRRWFSRPKLGKLSVVK
jgi:hypothetical protein